MKFDKHAAGYDKGFMGKGSSRFYIDLIREMDIKDGNSVLDVGCGTGTVLNYISREKKIRGFGIDVSEPMLAEAREKKTGCTFLVGNAGALPFDDASMDVIIACMAYHHFPVQEKFRKEVLRILNPGGHLYICDPHFPAPVRWFFNTFFKDAGFHSTKKNIETFTNMGFSVEKVLKDAYVQVLTFKKIQGNFI